MFSENMRSRRREDDTLPVVCQHVLYLESICTPNLKISFERGNNYRFVAHQHFAELFVVEKGKTWELCYYCIKYIEIPFEPIFYFRWFLLSFYGNLKEKKNKSSVLKYFLQVFTTGSTFIAELLHTCLDME